MKKELNVSGMMCEGCENRIKNALETVEGLDNVEANHENGKVEFNYTNEEDIEKAIKLIENLGFEVNE